MGENLLGNGGFELDWNVDKSHKCLIFPADGEPYETNVGNIFTPPGWVTWFRHDPDMWDQPEVRDAWRHIDPRRVRSGEKGVLLFTFCRRHDAGFFQQVQVESGTELHLTAWAHAWSNHLGTEHGGHPHDGRWSDGSRVGYDVVALETSQIPELNGNPQNDANGNVMFRVGIDPTGGTDPFADTVEWGKEWFVYNGYCQQLEAETVAIASVVTVFLRSVTQYAFTHNDAYWDDIELKGKGGVSPERGQPREQYERTYVLMPPDVTLQEVHDAVDRHFATRRTIGFSADDAGIGDLDERRVMVVRPGAWADSLPAFFEAYYPGVEYTVDGEEPPEPPPPPPPPPPSPTTRGHIGLHLQTMTGGWDTFTAAVRPPVMKVLASQQDVYGIKRQCSDTAVVWRHVTNDYHDTLEHPDPAEGARVWVDKFRDSLYDVCDGVAREFPNLPKPYFYVESLNEVYPSLNAEHVLRAVNFDMAFIEELRSTGLPVAAAVFCAAVGNPHESEFELLVPLAGLCEQTGSVMSGHAYWLGNADYGGPDHLWPYLAGRWVEMDKVFVANGVHVRWYSGEGGAVGGRSSDGELGSYALVSGGAAPLAASRASFRVPDGSPYTLRPSGSKDEEVSFAPGDWVSLLPNDGWKSLECYSGDWGRYLADIMRFDELVREWNVTHGYRFTGNTLFTTGAEYTGWPSFQIQGPETQGIRIALEERYG